MSPLPSAWLARRGVCGRALRASADGGWRWALHLHQRGWEQPHGGSMFVQYSTVLKPLLAMACRWTMRCTSGGWQLTAPRWMRVRLLVHRPLTSSCIALCISACVLVVWFECWLLCLAQQGSGCVSLPCQLMPVVAFCRGQGRGAAL